MDTEKQLRVVASYDFTDGGWPWQIQVEDESGDTRRYSCLMPHDIKAEQSVLSAMLRSNEALQDCLFKVDQNYFYQPENRTIYNALKYLFDNNRPVDPVSLADLLRSEGELERVGGMSHLLDLATDSFALVNLRHHVETLRHAAVLRQLMAMSSQTHVFSLDATDYTKETVDQSYRIRSLDSANQALRRLNDRLKTRNNELIKIIDEMMKDYLVCAGDLDLFESNDYHALEDYNLDMPILKRIENKYHGIKIRGYLNHLKELGIDL